jgi:hypothetical protein
LAGASVKPSVKLRARFVVVGQFEFALFEFALKGHGFTACGKIQGSYQGIALAIPQVLRNQTPL